MNKWMCKRFPHKMRLERFEYPHFYYKCVRCRVVDRSMTPAEKTERDRKARSD